HLRFGAQLAAALYDGMTWRVLVVGDCGARLNGTEVIATPNRGDGVLALLRSEVFTAARERLGGSVMNGTSSAVTDRALEVARAYTVSGSGSYLASFEDALPLEAYRESSEAAESRALSRFPDLPTELVRDTLAHGLLGIGKHRNKPGPLGTPCIDGTPVPPEQAHDRRIGKDALVTLELFSDGYFGCPPPGEVTL